MILILSTPRDYDTQAVIDWLHFKNTPFFRLNDEDIMTGKASFFLDPVKMEDSYIVSKNIKFYFKEITVVWYRKFGFFKGYQDEFGSKNDLVRYVSSEFSVLRTIIFNLLEDKKWLFKRKNMLTKLEILNLAHQFGLKIPNTTVTSKKTDLEAFFKNNNNSIISKSLGEGKHIQYEGKNYPFYTQKIEDLSKVTPKFSPSLFQGYIVKEYELRIFFIEKKFYSMVIFSQNNEKTKVDFRNYDFDNPNRVARYKLPSAIEKKLSNLMKHIGLNTGSIDLVKGIDGNYYFLEVNPSGQFGMTSFPCNYNLHKKVANYLIKKLD
ncbi:grasp-with-spasm system ATP-grasp peptide maturase [Kordia sp. YSTF-M3]|uniref:Grasp-with-spasm system ATP-grasp peptide maturase n=1 Tax=Kordia aestuariivivens TaxID=2759037 RepID=A0ABR7QD34_9FLAO|nr:grasp-with-spasm system ATP-grasp peptide maturase [Kordia aestuariivivens]MBC8756455.1 grasp-with-spasm system ATP-grasp peptide maturase [Kordia aestuariivivens]